jgi:hypothetical protein
MTDLASDSPPQAGTDRVAASIYPPARPSGPNEGVICGWGITEARLHSQRLAAR